MNILSVKNVILKMDGKTILNKLSIDFWKGYVHAIVGPNGAGKSTLAYTIMGLSDYRDFDGKITYKNKVISKMGLDERARLGITLAWQEPARFEGLSVKNFIMSGIKKKNEKKLRSILEQVGLDPHQYLNRKVDKTLSGGERKKIELASILIMEPEFVLLDEPDSGIDVASLQKIFEVIQFLKKRGTTIVLVTHSLEVLKQADHAFLLCHGQIIDKGEKEKIIPYFEDNCMSCIHKNEPDPKEVVN